MTNVSDYFNPPPGWPVPAGWSPPPGWSPPETWPAAPAGWQFWSTQPAPARRGYAAAGPAPEPGWSTAPPHVHYGVQRVPGAGLSAQFSAETQSLISAALLVPTVLLYYLSFDLVAGQGPWATWGWVAIIDLYFIVAVGLWAKTSSARLLGIGLAVTGTVMDRGLAAIGMETANAELTKWLYWLSYFSLLVFVAAWGVVRRRRPRWALGLIPAAGINALALWFYNSSTNNLGWVTFWAVDIGVLVAGCLLCWACDGIERP